MITNRSWQEIPQTYRKREARIVADWILRGSSGSVAGLPGAGKSNFLSFICHRPEVIRALLVPSQIECVLIPIDLNNLPDDSPATFYRVILRCFYEIREYLEPELQKLIESSYMENRSIQDPFLVQSALREIIMQCRNQGQQLGFVFDRFDDFCETALPHMTAALRGLRDSYKDALFYILGMRQEPAYLSESLDLGEIYELVDTNICWIGPMSTEDATLLIEQELAHSTLSPSKEEMVAIWHLAGGFPSLLKAICTSWLNLTDGAFPESWHESLLATPGVIHRLQEILDDLSQEELLALSEIGRQDNRRKKSSLFQKFDEQNQHVLKHLTKKGVCQPCETGWCITSELLTAFLDTKTGYGKGRIWWDAETEAVYQGSTLIQDLTPLGRGVLQFLLQYPRLRHTKTDLIVNAWPDELKKMGVSDDSLYQVIAGLRKKIEPIPAKPCYILNWRGKPEGGYLIFPEGRPA